MLTVYTERDITTFNDLYDICWSGAIQRLDEVAEYNMEDEFMEYLTANLGHTWNEHVSDTELNDFIWFECDDWLEEHKQEER